MVKLKGYSWETTNLIVVPSFGWPFEKYRELMLHVRNFAYMFLHKEKSSSYCVLARQNESHQKREMEKNELLNDAVSETAMELKPSEC